MSDRISVEVKSKEVLDAMKAMETTAKEGSKAFRAAFRKCVNKVKRGVVKSASTVTSNREKQKLVRATAYKSGTGGNVRAWQGDYLNSTGGRYFTLWWLEAGTSDVIGRNGRRHGATPPKPFFQEGVDSTLGPALDGLQEDILDELIKAYNKR